MSQHLALVESVSPFDYQSAHNSFAHHAKSFRLAAIFYPKNTLMTLRSYIISAEWLTMLWMKHIHQRKRILIL